MRVFCLVTVTNPDLYASNTLAFETLRTGFPTSDITVLINGSCQLKGMVKEKAERFGLPVYEHERPLFHADWVSEIIETNSSRTLYPDDDFAIVDGDTIFWKNCEWLMPSDYPWKGFYVPAHMNEWSDTMSMTRIHPSFIIGHAGWIKTALRTAYHRAYDKGAEYCGWKPFHPVTVAVGGDLRFYDTLSVAWNTIGGQIFNEDECDCFDHLNSASFYDIMVDRLHDQARDAFIKVHELAKTNPSALKGLWRNIRKYYSDRALLIK